MVIASYYLLRPLPPGLEGLAELALDLRWSWSHAADRLWERIAPELWTITRNPWLILQMVARNRLEDLAADPDFHKVMNDLVNAHRQAAGETTWFQQTYSKSSLSVAYFSMEFGLSEALPIYSGGLGILAGDYLKTASDLGIPVIGIGLLYQQGYFRQVLDTCGSQIEFYPYNDPNQLPVLPVRDTNDEWFRVVLDFPGRHLWLRVWEAKVGRVKLYLLDSNDPMNSPADRGITSELYGGGPELRLQQEIVLGIGGWRMLSALGAEPEVCHLNEGHAALAVIERARSFMESSGLSFDTALAATRAGNIFTTHTPVEAGFDRFSPDIIERYLGDYVNNIGISLAELLAMGRQNPDNRHEPLNMAYLAMQGSGIVNGVSRLHGEVSRHIFQPLFPRWPQCEVPVTYITNGVHMPSWDSAAADTLWSNACGKGRWIGTMDTIMDDLKKISDEVLWNFRMGESKQLIRYVRERLAHQLASLRTSTQEISQSRQLLDPEVFTIGFARRFASYKRPNLLLHDREHLARILNHPTRPAQLIIAGKAHPRDEEGKAMIREWSEFILRPDIRPHVIFLADYDMAIAEQLVQGVDLWINTPRRPWEACGTSGMKVLVNGGLNLSERDGWWAEAYRPEVGWAIGDGQEHGDDPGWDAREAQQLYQLLEQEIIPCFYDRDNDGIPRDWVARMRTSMAELTPHFSTNRMIREYVEKLYLPAASNYQNRIVGGTRKAALICQWRDLLRKQWPQLRFGRLEAHEENSYYYFEVIVHFGELNPGAVSVQIYAEPLNIEEAEIHLMARGEALADAATSYTYSARIETKRPITDYTPRIIPVFDGTAVPLEARQILWYE
jgi:starch phosphorylase